MILVLGVEHPVSLLSPDVFWTSIKLSDCTLLSDLQTIRELLENFSEKYGNFDQSFADMLCLWWVE
jgi:hypothetical protein